MRGSGRTLQVAGRMTRLILAVLLLAACTAPRGQHESFERAHPTAPAPAALGAPRDHGLDGSGGAPSSRSVAPATSGNASMTGTTSRTGYATWYEDPKSPSGFYAAVPSWRYGDDRYAIQVCLADRPGTCTHAVVRDFCACGDRHGEPTVVDLSPSAFRELAPLSRGVIRVTVTGPIPIPLPPTDKEEP